MKKYIKPLIEDEEIEIEDICTASPNNPMGSPEDVFNDDDENNDTIGF